MLPELIMVINPSQSGMFQMSTPFPHTRSGQVSLLVLYMVEGIVGHNLGNSTTLVLLISLYMVVGLVGHKVGNSTTYLHLTEIKPKEVESWVFQA